MDYVGKFEQALKSVLQEYLLEVKMIEKNVLQIKFLGKALRFLNNTFTILHPNEWIECDCYNQFGVCNLQINIINQHDVKENDEVLYIKQSNSDNYFVLNHDTGGTYIDKISFACTDKYLFKNLVICTNYVINNVDLINSYFEYVQNKKG